MTRSIQSAAATLAAATFACFLMSGCRVNDNHEDGQHKVDIGTPFGSLKVNTENTNSASATGLTAYPGATPVSDSGDSDGNSANVNMSFGSFHLGVKVANFQTPDQPDKVLAFYRKDLRRYSNVIECHGKTAVGQPTRTDLGLSCSDGSRGIQMNSSASSDNNIELRAGSEQHQHIVSVRAHDGGTKIGLVALDLPSHLSGHNGKDSE